MILDKNSYFLKRSNNSIWKFYFLKGKGLMYEIYNDNTLTESYVFSKEATGKFAVCLLPNDNIYVLYQNLDNELILKKCINNSFETNIILFDQTTDFFDIYFEMIPFETSIQIFFSIFNPEKNITTIFSQLLSNEDKISSPNLINSSRYHYEKPFTTYSTKNNSVFIIYQTQNVSHELRYKQFNQNLNIWSNSFLIDKSTYPFKDFSIINFEKSIYSVYIKFDGNTDSLIYTYKNNSKKLFKSMNLNSCLLYIIYNEIWCFATDEKQLINTFSINNGETFSNIFTEPLLESSKIFKGKYTTYNSKEKEILLSNEIYFSSTDNLKYLNFYNVHSDFNSKNNISINSLHFDYYKKELSLKILFYEKYLKEKDSAIQLLNKALKIHSIDPKIFEQELSKKLFLIQENLDNREAQITNLENIFCEKFILIQEQLKSKDYLIANLENTLDKKKKDISILSEELKKINEIINYIFYNVNLSND